MITAERLWQGDRNARIRLDKEPWGPKKIFKKGMTHLTWLAIGLLTGGAMVFYFRDAPTLARELVTGQAPYVAYLFLGIFALTTYVLEHGCGMKEIGGHDALADRATKAAEHMKAGAPFATWKSDPFLALATYVHLIEGFGWKPFERVFAAYRALSAYDTGRPFSTWLLSIAAHHCIDRIRRRRMHEVSLDALPPWRQLAAQTPDPEDVAVYQDHSRRVRQYLQLLPEDYRLVVVLRYWHDFGYAEIAALTGESESAIKSRLHRARRQLAEHMTAGVPGLPSVIDAPDGIVGPTAGASEPVAAAGAAMAGS